MVQSGKQNEGDSNNCRASNPALRIGLYISTLYKVPFQNKFKKNDMGKAINGKKSIICLFCIVVLIIGSISYFNAADEGQDFEVQMELIPDGDWDATNGSYLGGEKREVISQITYRLNDPDSYKEPGDIELKIPNLGYKCKDSLLDVEISSSGINTGTTSNNWNIEGTLDENTEYFILTNAKTIDGGIEGHFQISYVFTSKGVHEEVIDGRKCFMPPYDLETGYYEDKCEYDFSSSTNLVLTDKTTGKTYETDMLHFNYHRTYDHEWKTRELEFQITALAKNPYVNDEYKEEASKYNFVEYKYFIPGEHPNYGYSFYDQEVYPYKKVNNANFVIDIPEGCVVLSNGEIIDCGNEYTSDNVYGTELVGVGSPVKYVVIGYPKDMYNNAENAVVKNHSTLYIDNVYSDEQTLEINIGEFDFEYDEGDGLGVQILENLEVMNQQLFYEPINDGEGSPRTDEKDGNNEVLYTYIFNDSIKTKHDVFYGFDLMYAPDGNNNFKRLDDDEYYIQRLIFPIQLFDNDNNIIPNGKYDVELWIRERGESEYKLHKEFKIGDLCIAGTQENYVGPWYDIFGTPKGEADPNLLINGYYFKIKDVENGCSVGGNYNWGTQSGMMFMKFEDADIARNGNIWAINYIKAHKDGVLMEMDIAEDCYKWFAHLADIPQYDMDTHGGYIIRASVSVPYTTIETYKQEQWLRANKETKITNQDEGNERFLGSSKTTLDDNEKKQLNFQMQKYLNKMPDDNKIKGIHSFELLPLGMDMLSTEDEILESVDILPEGSDLSYLFFNNGIGTDVIKDNMHCEIIENWNDTGRTWVHVWFDLDDDRMTVIKHGWTTRAMNWFTYDFDFSISYDSFIDNNTYTSDVYAMWESDDGAKNMFERANEMNSIIDTESGKKDISNGIFDNMNLAYGTDTLVITAMSSSEQGIRKYVSVDGGKTYSDKQVESSINGEYVYKIRVQTGQSKVTNLIIYDDLEQAYGSNNHWTGILKGFDISHAKENSYDVNIYVSEVKSPGDLYIDGKLNPLYTLYNGSQTKVKSVAFEYMNGDKPAVLPKNSTTYILINMKAPATGSMSLAYNNARSAWNTCDDFGVVNGGFKGLTSNTTKVSLPFQPQLLISKKIDSSCCNGAIDCIEGVHDNDYKYNIILESEDGNKIALSIQTGKKTIVNGIGFGTWKVAELHENGSMISKPYYITIDDSSDSFELVIENKANDQKEYRKQYEVRNYFAI